MVKMFVTIAVASITINLAGGVTRLTYSNDEKASNLIWEIKGSRVQKIIVGTQLN
jgi:hypothetical protein